MDVIALVTSKSMIDAFGKSDEVTLLDVNTNPLVFSITYIEKARSIQDVSNFLGIVNVLFSPDGKHLVFSSNRNNGGTRETNLFLAEWQD